MAITKKQRSDVEELVLKTMTALDKSGINTEYYKNLFAGLSDTQFENLIKKQFPFKFQVRPSETEPSMDDIEKALKVLKVPLLEKVYLPHQYINKDGVPVNSKECFVGYVHHKKVQQIITKKNKWATEIANRDMRTGRLNGADKGSATSDREFEAMAVLGFNKTMNEFSRPRADAMDAKNAMYNTINYLGKVSEKDIPISDDDPLSKNMMNVYLLGAGLNSNIVNKGNYTAYTLKRRNNGIKRI